MVKLGEQIQTRRSVPTRTESRIKQRQDQLKEKAERVLQDVQSGKINDISQVPEDVKPFINVQEVATFLEERRKQQEALEEQRRKERAFQVLKEQIKRNNRDNLGFISSRRRQKVREAFERAGLDADKGEDLFVKGVTGRIALKDEEGKFIGGLNLSTGTVSKGGKFLGKFSFDTGTLTGITDKFMKKETLEEKPADELQFQPLAVEEEKKLTSFQQFRSDLGTAGGFLSDLAGAVFLKDVTVSDITKETTISEEEAKAGQSKIVLAGLDKNIFGLPKFNLQQSQVQAFIFRRELREGSEEAKDVRATQEKQIDVIKSGISDLEVLNEQVINLQKKAEDPILSQQKADLLNKEADRIDKKRAEIFSNLESKGVSVVGTSTEEGQAFTFTSPELEADLTPAGLKQLRGASKKERTVRIVGRLGIEATEFAVIGLATGSLGAGARLGGLLTKVPKVVKIGGAVGLSGLIGFQIGKGGVSGFERGKAEGLGVEGAVLGAGVPLAQLTGFTAGAFAGSRVFASRTISKVKAGGTTKSVAERSGAERVGKTATGIKQDTVSVTKIPNTNIKITQKSGITSIETSKQGFGSGTGKAVVTGLKGGGKQRADTFFLFRRKGGSTGIIAVTETSKGVTIQQIRSTATIKNVVRGLPKTVNVAGTPITRQKILLEILRTNVKSADDIFVAGSGKKFAFTPEKATAVDKAIKQVDLNKLVKGFGDEPVVSISRTLQKVNTQQVGSVKEFQSFGVTTSLSQSRLNKLLGLIRNQINRGDFLVIGKKGQLFPKTLPKPKAPSNVPPINPALPSQDLNKLTVSVITDAITPEIRSALTLKTLEGSATLTPLGLRARDRLSDLQKEDLSTKVRSFTRQQPLTKQDLGQPQREIQQQTPIQQEQLVQRLAQIPQFEVPTVTSPIEIVNIPRVPFSPPVTTGIGLAFGSPKRKKRKRKDEEFLIQQDVKGFLPDFTSKIVGLPPLEVTESEGQKLVNKVLTGFEVRRGARVVR
jgi:hypothetical protein